MIEIDAVLSCSTRFRMHFRLQLSCYDTIYHDHESKRPGPTNALKKESQQQTCPSILNKETYPSVTRTADEALEKRNIQPTMPSILPTPF